MTPVREWRLHLGAHKTATTHLQDTLATYRPQLIRQGLDYLPVRAARPVIRAFSRKGWRRGLWSPPMAVHFRGRLDALRQGPDTVLLSEEDMLGYAFDQLTVPLYCDPPALHLIRALAATGARVKLFLAIRALDGLIPSAYAQSVKALPPPAGGMDAIRARLADTLPSWVELIERLTRALPGMELRVWRYEDYRDNWRGILDLYAGREAVPWPELPPPPKTVSPSGRAIALAEAVDPALPMRARSAEVLRHFAEHPADGPDGPYRPLDQAEIARFRECYAADLDEIGTRFPGMLIRPGAKETP